MDSYLALPNPPCKQDVLARAAVCFAPFVTLPSVLTTLYAIALSLSPPYTHTR